MRDHEQEAPYRKGEFLKCATNFLYFFPPAIHFFCSDLLLFRPSRRRWRAGTRACRTACVWATSPPYGTEPPSPSSGRTDTPSRTSSSRRSTEANSRLCGCAVNQGDGTAWVCRCSGSRSGSARRGRTSRGRGSSWGRGSRRPWLPHLHPAWSRTSERAGATARRMKRKMTSVHGGLFQEAYGSVSLRYRGAAVWNERVENH